MMAGFAFAMLSHGIERPLLVALMHSAAVPSRSDWRQVLPIPPASLKAPMMVITPDRWERAESASRVQSSYPNTLCITTAPLAHEPAPDWSLCCRRLCTPTLPTGCHPLLQLLISLSMAQERDEESAHRELSRVFNDVTLILCTLALVAGCDTCFSSQRRCFFVLGMKFWFCLEFVMKVVTLLFISSLM